MTRVSADERFPTVQQYQTVIVAADASIIDDNGTVVVAAAAAVDKSTTDEGRTIVEGDESVVVNEMFDELTKVDGSAVDDVLD